MIEYTKEDLERFKANHALLKKLADAEARADEAAEDEIWRQIVIPAESLLATKLSFGADWIRREGLNTSEAERKWGKDWLDRDIS